MATLFSSLPLVDLGCLRQGARYADIPSAKRKALSNQLYDVFATTGFAYLVNAPLNFSHDDIFQLAKEFFGLPEEVKMGVAKKTFDPRNSNTYRGYFPTQPLSASDNLKEGFEIGPAHSVSGSPFFGKFNLSEANVWPVDNNFKARARMEQLYSELQDLAAQLLSLLAVSLGKAPEFFDNYLESSLSTLRLLHYPAVHSELAGKSATTLKSVAESVKSFGSDDSHQIKLSCTPHTDSGILTLLHQDNTGGLEVRNAANEWVSAPYVPGSIVVNIGDLMAEVSGGRFVATMHRVRAPPVSKDTKEGFGRFSVPFFFEPGERCIVRSVDDDGTGAGLLYGEHARAKMSTWVEYQSDDDDDVE